MDSSKQSQQSALALNHDTLVNPASRKAFLATLMAGAAAATTLAAAPASVFASTGKLKHVAAGFPKSDADILNFALTLEHLEARFYQMASQRMGSGNYVHQLIGIIHNDEAQHVAGLTAAIKQGGYTPVAAAMHYNFPAVFGSRNAFLGFAGVLEQTGVHAYLGQAPLVKTPSILLTAASIVTVEARHTGAIYALLKKDPTQGAFDKGFTKAQVLAIAGPLIGK